ncbi:nuclear pore complex protein NUP96 [Amborella trichopoda]|nr:nuclear pore complex protein NUP96 [Amborella trichopoda]|eukprot:XP_006894942.2 nuclear pore complex protein NUP96 [Amborella trichopoda]
MMCPMKKRKTSEVLVSRNASEMESILPVLLACDYYTVPSLSELAARECVDSGYCQRVQDFTVGRLGYGVVKFLGETDVRWLKLDQVIQFNQQEVVVYEDGYGKPLIGMGLNKAAEVTLVLKVKVGKDEVIGGQNNLELEKLRMKLKGVNERQGARFISYDPSSHQWKFLVPHFSRFGLDAEDDIDMVPIDNNNQQELGPIVKEVSQDVNEEDEMRMDVSPSAGPSGSALVHSLPAHLGLDPLKMQEMRMLMFQNGEENEDENGSLVHKTRSSRKEGADGGVHGSVLQLSAKKSSHNVSPNNTSSNSSPFKILSPLSPSLPNKQALLDYISKSGSASPPRNILMIGQNKGTPTKTTKVKGFKLDPKHETPIGTRSNIIADAGLFMGRSFRVGWGPNGLLVHSGTPICDVNASKGLSSIIHIEKVALDATVRDEDKKVKEDLINLRFDSPLRLHRSLRQDITEIETGSFKLKLQKLVCSRSRLPEVCRGHVAFVERQLDVSGLSRAERTILMHQVMAWELINVLFSEREAKGSSESAEMDDAMDMMLDKRVDYPDVESEAEPLIRRSDFSSWLQESVCHRVQEEMSRLNEGRYLETIFSLLTGRQLGAAVELAVDKGDVRMACLLSQAGGSMVNRSDMTAQIDVWKMDGLDFNFIEKERLKLYELLSGNIHGALLDSELDWKRHLGLLMWYHLPPDTSLPVIVQTYQQLLHEGRAPYPIPFYVDEGPLEEATGLNFGGHFDLTYYLMLLHANRANSTAILKTMFSSPSSTYDALDYHMIWHQRSVLEAIGALDYKDFYVLDMSFVSQLLCLGQCHLAIYVVLHMPQHDDHPHLHASIIREILFQYCETWSSHEMQRKFIEDLGIPSAWMHEALAVYYQYYGDLSMALDHLLESSNWQRAHSIFMTSVSHSLFLSSQHSEIWRLAISMEGHKSEIADWDLGAGIYIYFYLLKSSFEDENTMAEFDSLEKKNDECRAFFSRLKDSLSVWGNRLLPAARGTYSKMAEELSTLLSSRISKGSTRSSQLSCLDTILDAPMPEDIRSCHLQDAISVFTFWLSEVAS